MTINRKEKIIQAFDARVEAYDRYADIQKDIANQLSLYFPDQVDNILEIGCGTGFLTKNVIEKYPNIAYDVTDISPKMLEYTRQKLLTNPTMNFFTMDGEEISIDKKYDLIVSSMAFQWFDRSEESIKKILNYLTDQGVLIFSTLHPHSFKEWYKASKKSGVGTGLLSPVEIRDATYVGDIKKTYASGMEFLQELKRIGANTPDASYKSRSLNDLKRLCAAFDRGEKTITWRIAYHVIKKSEGAGVL